MLSGKEEGTVKEMTMKLIFVMAVLLMVFLAAATSLAAPPNAEYRDQGQSAAETSPPNLRLWKDPDAIEGLNDILFDFDTHESASEQAILEANAQWLKNHPDVRFKIDAYTDPKGEIVYNLALSQRRAETVKQELIRIGIPENRIVFATGWGELYPNCLEATEECWKKNRRVEFVRASE